MVVLGTAQCFTRAHKRQLLNQGITYSPLFINTKVMEADFQYRDFTLEQLQWLDQHFDECQQRTQRKWLALAKRVKMHFHIPGVVSGGTVRNKLIAYWVCFDLYCH